LKLLGKKGAAAAVPRLSGGEEAKKDRQNEDQAEDPEAKE
jgi:hypothetical protein